MTQDQFVNTVAQRDSCHVNAASMGHVSSRLRTGRVILRVPMVMRLPHP
jgi:hypothetical protein